jgi:hypothetical protein
MIRPDMFLNCNFFFSFLGKGQVIYAIPVLSSNIENEKNLGKINSREK